MYRLLITICLLVTAAITAAENPTPQRESASDSYHGVKVADPWRWLEDWTSAEVKSWSEKQNNAARKVLDGLPMRAEIAQQVESVTVSDTVSYYAGQRVGDKAWFMKYAPPKQQPFLVQLDLEGNTGVERIVFDPTSADESASTSIEWFRISPNGKLAAIALTVAGAEVADLYIFDSHTGEHVDEVLPRVNAATAGGDLSWDADSNGFFYTRYPREGEVPDADLNFYQQLWHRQLGEPLSDDHYELGNNFDRIAEIRVKRHHASGNTLLTMQYGDSGKFQLYLRDRTRTWHRLSDYDDQLVQAEFIDGDSLLVLSRKSAPRGKFVLVDISKLPSATSQQLVAESDYALASNFYSSSTFIVHNGLIYAKVLLGGPEELRVYDLQGKPQAAPAMEVSGVGQILPWGDEVLIRQFSYLRPNSWLHFDGKSTTRHSLSSSTAVSFDDYKVAREFATSLDGTRVPVNIITAKGAVLDGTRPMLLTGYGGYGISLSPGFNPTRKIWLDQGGAIAVANLRGGGEFGEDWHRKGMLANKQNVFDDFHAVMKHLVQRGYTRKSLLAIEGGSNGGLLMGAMITQHPEDFQVTISHVGIYDSLRNELSANGAFNIPEFGSVKDPLLFHALHAYSPYHNVKSIAYPSILFMTGENDGRVDPMHSRKMTAALQTANTADTAVLLRTSGNTGHGAGTPLKESISQQVDRLVFLFDALGMQYKNPATATPP